MTEGWWDKPLPMRDLPRSTPCEIRRSAPRVLSRLGATVLVDRHAAGFR